MVCGYGNIFSRAKTNKRKNKKGRSNSPEIIKYLKCITTGTPSIDGNVIIFACF